MLKIAGNRHELFRLECGLKTRQDLVQIFKCNVFSMGNGKFQTTQCSNGYFKHLKKSKFSVSCFPKAPDTLCLCSSWLLIPSDIRITIIETTTSTRCDNALSK